MERTQIENTVGDEETLREQWWRRRLGMTQLKCPYCFKWFTLPRKDFKIDENGNVSDVVYHFCDDDFHPGWVVLPQLVGWGQR